MATIDIRSVSKAYGTHAPVLSGIDLSIRDGEFVVLVGPSGCGKSTLLRMIAGLEAITAGTIAIGGTVVNDLAPKARDIAMVFQSYALYPHMTVAENLAFGLKLRKHDKAEIDRRIARAAEILQIQPLLDRKPAALSGGQRQRVAIGRALVRDVDVFLFDEPLSNLDAKLRSELRVEIKRLHQQLKNTMIYVTHDQIEALTLADRIAVMRGGIIQQLADPKTIYNKPANLFVAGFIGSPAMTFLKGEIGERDGGKVFVTGSETIALESYRGEVPEAGRKAILGVRPEHVAVGRDAARATVDIDEPMGSDSLLWLSFSGQTLSARAPAEHGFQSGETVGVSFDISKASLFDIQTEQRL